MLGEGRGCHTAIKQFGKLKESKQALTDITEAFSVETLTKQFYKDLFEWYQWAIDDSTQVTFPNNITTEDDDRDDVERGYTYDNPYYVCMVYQTEGIGTKPNL